MGGFFDEFQDLGPAFDLEGGIFPPALQQLPQKEGSEPLHAIQMDQLASRQAEGFFFDECESFFPPFPPPCNSRGIENGAEYLRGAVFFFIPSR